MEVTSPAERHQLAPWTGGEPGHGAVATITAHQAGALKQEKYLGRGSSAVVSACSMHSPKGVQQVAMKRIHTELLEDPSEVRNFVEEVRLLKNLNHRFIVEFYGCGWPHDQPVSGQAAHNIYFLQEYMAGGTLHQMVLKAMSSPVGHKVYTDADALRWALQVAQALDYVHSQTPKIIHRDLKMENILLTSTKAKEATAKLADFGLARKLHGSKDQEGSQHGPARRRSSDQVLSVAGFRGEKLNSFARAGSDELELKLNAAVQQQLEWSSLDTQETAQRTVVYTAKTGSLGYMAPEVLQGLTYNEKADVFSFAIVLYNLFHRNIPTVHIVLNGDVEDLEAYAHQVAAGYRPAMSATINPGVAALIERCWKGLPELRPSMATVVEELERLSEEQAAVNSTRQQLAQEADAGKNGCCTIM